MTNNKLSKHSAGMSKVETILLAICITPFILALGYFWAMMLGAV